MAHLIKEGTVQADDWIRVGAEQAHDAPLPRGKLLVPVGIWLARREELLGNDEAFGIWLDSDAQPGAIVDALASVALVAVNFPVFSDGRGYSIARLLREKYGYRGELRAIGDVLRDQLFLMWRCGFDSFRIRDDRDASDALPGLGDFTHVYQWGTRAPGSPLLGRGGAGA